MKTIHIILLIINVAVLILSVFSPLSVMMIPHQISLPVSGFTFGPILGRPSNSGTGNQTDVFLNVINDKLESAKFIPLGSNHGPETITFSKGSLYFAVKSGEIRVIQPPFTTMSKEEFKSLNDSSSSELDKSKLVTVVGRALGLKTDKYDNLVIADTAKGLLYYNIKTDQLLILASSYEGKKITFTNDVAVDKENEIFYFTDSSSIGPILDKYGDWNTLIPTLYTCASQVQQGRVFSYSMKTKELKLIGSGIRYANGVALDSKKESVFVVETCTSRVLRFWFSGSNKGKSEIFIDNLPGYPDGIDVIGGEVIVSIFGGRSYISDFIQQYPIIKNIVFRIPFVKPPILPSSIVKADSMSGKITNYYLDRGDLIKTITSTTTFENKLYLGNLLSNFIGVLDQ